MNETGKTIAKNASVMMLSQILTWGMALVFMFFVPRKVGAVGMGQLQLAAALWGIVDIVVSFGMDTFLTKEIARAPEKVNELLSASVVLRMLLFIPGVVGLGLYTKQAGYPDTTVMIIILIGISSFIGQLTSAFKAALNGLERMEYVSIAGIMGNGVSTLLSIIFLFMGYGVAAVALFSTFGNLVNMSIGYLGLRRVQDLHFQKFDWSLARLILKSSYPFLIMNGFLVFYMQVDVIIISLLISEKQVGWYGSADRLFGTLLFIPLVYMTAVFPALSRMQASASDLSTKLTRLSFDLLNLVAVPIGLGLLVIANQLVVLVFGADFTESGPVLMVFGIVLILTYQNLLVGMSLIAADRQKPWTRIIITAALLSIPLDLVFIPWCQQAFGNGAIGGALAFVVTEAFMLTAGIYLLPKGTLNQANLSYALRTVLAGLIMLASIWWLRDIFIVIPIVVGAAVYLVSIFILGLLTPEMRNIIRLTVAKIKQRLGLAKSQLAVDNPTK